MKSFHYEHDRHANVEFVEKDLYRAYCSAKIGEGWMIFNAIVRGHEHLLEKIIEKIISCKVYEEG